MPQTQRWERRRAEIASTSASIFAEKGLAGARLEDIAERVGLNRASLVYYFRDKQQIYEAALAGLLEELRARIEAALYGGTSAERLQAMAAAWVDFLAERPDAARIFLREVLDIIHKTDPATMAPLQSLMRIVREEIAEGEARDEFAPGEAAACAAIVAGSSLLWISIRPLARHSWAFDTLETANLDGQRHRLVAIADWLLAGGSRARPGG